MITKLVDLDELMLGQEHNGTVMSPEEFDEIDNYDESYNYELVHGVLIVNPIPLAEETGPNEELGRLLLNHRADHLQGKLLDYTLPEQHVRTPDSRRRADRLLWIGLGRLPNVKKDVPTIAVEFVSEGKRSILRDYVEKKREYIALGIKEYWIIDRFRRIMTVFRSQPGEAEEIVIPEEQKYLCPLLPGFKVPLAHLLQLADQFAQAE